MKRFVLFVWAALLLAAPVWAVECVDRLDSDGDMCRECDLGNFGADALRAYTGSDLAFFASGDLGITLPAGTVTAERLAESFPYDKPVVLTKVSAEEVRELLEQSLSHIVLGEDERIRTEDSAYAGFFCVSGFQFSYDASAPVGQRVYDLPLAGEYTLAISAEYADGEPAGSIREAVESYAESLPQIGPAEERITVLGAWDKAIIGGWIPKEFVLILAAVAIVYGGAKYRRRLNTER